MWGPVPTTEVMVRCKRLLTECAGEPERESLIRGALALLATMAGSSTRHLAATSSAAPSKSEGIWLVSFHLAEASLCRGDTAALEADLRPIYDDLKRIGEKSHFSPIAQLLADAVYLEGRLDEAEQLTLECESAAQANDVHDQIRWRAVRAKVLASRGEFRAAEELAREAAALAEEGDFLFSHGGVLMDLAEVLALSGRHDDAPAVAQEAIRCFGLKGNVVAAEQALTRLEALGA